MNHKSAFDFVKGRYGTLTVFANDTGAATQSVLKYGEWAENEISFLQRLVKAGCTVLDIGAYIGTHTLAFARFAGPTGRVIAVEAQPNSFEVLKKNVAENVAAGLPDIVELKNAVASSEPGQVTISTINVQDEGSFGSTSLLGALTGAAGDASDHVQLPAITVDSLDLQDCALIKIDVEGVENMVLQGALQTLERCSPFVYCECNTLAAGLKSVAVLENARYKVFAHVVDAFNRENYFVSKENIFGDAREVALVAAPLALAERLRSLPVRSCELLLDIENADDLALALLNKPQYPAEALRHGRAAATGGARVLDQLDASKIELGRLQNDNIALLRRRRELNEEVETVHRKAAASLKEKYDEIAALNAVSTQCHTDVAHLRNEAKERGQEMAGLQAKTDQLQAKTDQLQAKTDELQVKTDELQALTTNLQVRTTELQANLSQKESDIAQLHVRAAQRDAEINHLADLRTANEQEIRRLNGIVSTLHASRSWRVTKPLRWAMKLVDRK